MAQEAKGEAPAGRLGRPTKAGKIPALNVALAFTAKDEALVQAGLPGPVSSVIFIGDQAYEIR